LVKQLSIQNKKPPTKNTLLKNAQANATSIFFKRVFFLTPEKKFCQRFFKKRNLFSAPALADYKLEPEVL